jgi:drug/metabolite transporter (DMT)-like permease
VPPPTPARAYVALLAIVTLWGSYPATAKLALLDFPPVFLAAVRCTIASAFLAVLLARSSAETIRGLSPGALRAFFVLGVAGIFVSTNLSYVAIYFSTASHVVILQTAAPVIVALAARFYLGERLGVRQWLGVALSAFGVVLVITQGRLAALRPDELRVGDFVNLVALSAWSVYTVYGKRVLEAHSPALATTAAYVLGTLLLIPTAVLTAPLFPAPRLGSPVAWAVVAYQAFLGAVAHLWWYRAVQVVGPSRSAIFMNVQPVVGLVLAATLLSEEVGRWPLVGAGFVLGGVALTTRGQAGST